MVGKMEVRWLVEARVGACGSTCFSLAEIDLAQCIDQDGRYEWIGASLLGVVIVCGGVELDDA